MEYGREVTSDGGKTWYMKYYDPETGRSVGKLRIINPLRIAALRRERGYDDVRPVVRLRKRFGGSGRSR